MLHRRSKIVISTLFLPLCWLRRLLRSLFRRGVPSCVVLYYHGVSRAATERFKRQLDIALRWAKLISLNGGGTPPVGGKRHYVALTFDDGFQSFFDNAVPELVRRSIPFAVFVPAGYLGKKPGWSEVSDFALTTEVVMTAGQLRTLPPALATIGAHSMTHPKFSELDGKGAWQELQQSKRVLEEVTGRKVELFSFPYGAYNQESLQLARDAGFRLVLASKPMPVRFTTETFMVGRVSVNPEDSEWEFFLKMMGCYSWVPYASASKRTLLEIAGALSSFQEPI